MDVDAAVDVRSYSQWQKLQGLLHDCGVVVRANAEAGKGRSCLFHLGQIEVDILPVRFEPIVRASPMFELGSHCAETHQLGEDLEILALSGPGFLAAKLEAFADRGIQDVFMSKDLEDIVALLDGRIGIEQEVFAAFPEIRQFIAEQTHRLFSKGDTRDVISDLLRDRERARRLFELLAKFSSMPF